MKLGLGSAYDSLFGGNIMIGIDTVIGLIIIVYIGGVTYLRQVEI